MDENIVSRFIMEHSKGNTRINKNDRPVNSFINRALRYKHTTLHDSNVQVTTISH